MSRIVIHVLGHKMFPDVFMLEEPTVDLDGQPPICSLQCLSADSPFRELGGAPGPDVVHAAGNQLFTKLSSHEGVRKTLVAALGVDEPKTVYLRIDPTSEAERLPWEAMCDAKRFLALDERWPIARMAGEFKRLAYDFAPPLRMVAVLAASGVDPRPEWSALLNGIMPLGLDGKRSAPPLPLKLVVLCCDKALVDDIAAVRIPGVDSALVPDMDGLKKQLRAFNPHVLHFFCHGSAADGPHLNIAQYGDWIAGMEGNRLEPGELRTLRGEGLTTWLVTLNCCNSAAVGEDVTSIARALAETGFPAVVGMRETVDSLDANTLSATMYGPLLRKLQKSIVQDDEFELDWAELLSAPRQELAGRYALGGVSREQAARSHKPWSLPVLYVNRYEFQVRRVTLNPDLSPQEVLELTAELKTLKSARVGLQPTVTVALLAELDKRIQEVERKLYP